MSGNTSRTVCDHVLSACRKRRQTQTDRHLIGDGAVKALAGRTRDIEAHTGQICGAIRVHFNTVLDADRCIAAAGHRQITAQLETNHISLCGCGRRIVIDCQVRVIHRQTNARARGNAHISCTDGVDDQLASGGSRNRRLAALVQPDAGHSVTGYVNGIRPDKFDLNI